MTMGLFYVRLKPHQPNKGFTVRTYGLRGLIFRTGGWYKIKDASLAKELSQLHQRLHDETSPMLFDVTDEAGAKAMEQRERDLQRFGVSRAKDVTARSMKAGHGGKPGRSARGRPAKVSVPQEGLSTADLNKSDDEPELTEEEVLDGLDIAPEVTDANVALDGADEDGDAEPESPEIEDVGRMELDEDRVTDPPEAEDVQPEARPAKPPPAKPAGKAAKAPAKKGAAVPRTRQRR
jgi:hypothetical protein